MMTSSSSSNSNSNSNNVANILNGFDKYNDDDDDNDETNNNNDDHHYHPQQQQQQHLLLLFKPKFQYSVKNNPLCGICFKQWITILKKRYNQIEYRIYWLRIVVITLLSIFNSFLSLIESILYPNSTINNIQINSNPIFILGHPRTGTTLLHSLLALDSNEFDICTTFCSGFPSCFLWFESIGKRLFANIIDKKRPMDNIPLNFDLPQEDELATNLLSGGISPYMPLFFMKQEYEFRSYYTFDDSEEEEEEEEGHLLSDELLSQDKNQWINSFIFLLKKLTLRGILQRRRNNKDSDKNNNNKAPLPKRLLLKSPVHTARIRLLLQLFPDAQFIYIHRHPYDVLRSAIHMADTTYWYTYLNTPSQEQILEFILKQYEILWSTYENDRKLLLLEKPNQLIEVSYEELTEDPITTIENIYQHLGWKLSSKYKTKLVSQLSSRQHTTYQRNNHKQLPDYLKSIINIRWKESFDRLGYKYERHENLKNLKKN